MRESWRDAFLSAGTAALASVPALMLSAHLLEGAGMRFDGCFTATCLLMVVFALWMAYRGVAIVFSPSAGLTVACVYFVLYGEGFSWQEMLLLHAAAGALGFALWSLPAGEKVFGFFPRIVRQVFPAALALLLIYASLVLGRIVIHSPWAVTGLGSFTDPMAYLSLTGLLVFALLYVRRVPHAPLWSFLVVMALSLGEGFWVMPGPFWEPEGLDRVAAMLDTRFLGDAHATLLAAGVLVTMLFAMSVYALSVLQALSSTMGGQPMTAAGEPEEKTRAEEKERALAIRRVLRGMFLLQFAGAWLGALPCLPSPVSAAMRQGSRQQGRRTALALAACFVLVLFTEPVWQNLADFPAAAVPALAGIGLLWLIRWGRSVFPRIAWQREEAVTALAVGLILPLSFDFVAAAAIGTVLYVCLLAVSGRRSEVSRGTQVLALLFLAYLFFVDL